MFYLQYIYLEYKNYNLLSRTYYESNSIKRQHAVNRHQFAG